MPVARSPQGQAVADLTSADATWDEAALDDDAPYETYVRDMPTKEEMRPYKTPVQYWEPEFPGMALMPYPRLGHFESSADGRWACHNQGQETEVRSHLSRYGDPDDLKVTDEQLAIIQGKAPGESRYCHTAFCHFVSCSPLVTRLHETLRGHTTKPEPRKDR